MPDNKDCTQLTHEELLAAEKKLKRQEITSAVIIGFLTGVMIYGVVKGGFGFLYIVIPLILIYGIYRNSQSGKHHREQIRAEINARGSRQ